MNSCIVIFGGSAATAADQVTTANVAAHSRFAMLPILSPHYPCCLPPLGNGSNVQETRYYHQRQLVRLQMSLLIGRLRDGTDFGEQSSAQPADTAGALSG
jgi:hypothetical protein